MCRRNLIGCTLVLGLLLLPGFVGCQTAADYSAMKDKIDDLSKSVKAMSDEMHDVAKGWATQKDLDAVRERILAGERELVQLKTDLAAAHERLAKEGSSATEIASLKEKLAKLEKDLQAITEVAMEQRKIIEQIVKTDGAGNAILSIGQVTTNPQFTAAVDDAVGKAINKLAPPPPPWSTVRIDNRMLNSQYIEVNGSGHWVGPQSILDVNVPVGWATTRLVGYEAAKSWWLGTPGWFQTVIIDQKPLYNSVVRYP